MSARVLHADGVAPGDAVPIADGAVVVDDGGAILDVGRAAELLPRHAGAPVERVRGAILPGLVNAHTHVELSAMRGAVRGGAGFVAWVDELVSVRSELAPEDDADAIARAVSELDAFGTVAVGEVTNSLAAVDALARARFAGCVFHEVFGVAKEGALRRVRALVDDVEDRLGRWSSVGGRLAYALAPHTLYTTHPDAVRAILEHARARGRRTSVHVAESAGERRAIERGDGPMTEWIARRVRVAPGELTWPKAPLFALASELGALAPNVLLVHLTDAREDELARVAEAGSPVVLCPRSNLYIETKLPPLLAMRAAGIAPALGTDSLASCASLDVLAEARALSDRFPRVAPRELVAMATWNGARALGTSGLGRIAPGARPGLFAIEGDLAGLDACAFALRHVKAPRRWLVRHTI